jgi:hypothetical protein
MKNLFTLPLPNDFTYNIGVRASEKIIASVTYPPRYIFSRKGIDFVAKFAALVLMKKEEVVTA